MNKFLLSVNYRFLARARFDYLTTSFLLRVLQILDARIEHSKKKMQDDKFSPIFSLGKTFVASISLTS